jgi:hypothetical protein
MATGKLIEVKVSGGGTLYASIVPANKKVTYISAEYSQWTNDMNHIFVEDEAAPSFRVAHFNSSVANRR